MEMRETKGLIVLFREGEGEGTTVGLDTHAKGGRGKEERVRFTNRPSVLRDSLHNHVFNSGDGCNC